MTLRALVALVLLAAVAATEARPENKAQTASQRIFEKAQGILGSVKETEYQQKTTISEKDGVYKTDCSGFVDYILKEVAREHYRQIPFQNPHRPFAEDLYDFFCSLPQGTNVPAGKWGRIEAFGRIRKGDILVYKYTPEVREEKGTTGHVMIVASDPAKQSNGEYMVIVIDSARGPHGEDSRRGGNGVGHGKMWFGVDKKDRPVYYRWSKSSGDKHKSDIEGIVIGRAF